MTKEQLIQLLSQALEKTEGKGSGTRYICFNPFLEEYRIVHNSDVVKTSKEVSHYIGRAPNSELDYERIALQINGACLGKFGIAVIKDEFITGNYGFIDDEQILSEYGE